MNWQNERIYWLLLGLFVLGFLLNLGVHPYFMEEPRRAIVAMELLENGNLWVPTLFGQYYYNKPPLFNWVLILFAQLPGGFTEFNLRLPTVLSNLSIGYLTFWMVKRHLGSREMAWMTAFLWFSAAGILFFFSFLGEIDLFFSFLILAGIFAVYHFGEKKAYWPLFLGMYLSCALGVLTKGLPPFVFTATTLLVYFVDRKQFKLLFHPAHFAGIALLFGILGAYYYQYSRYHELEAALMRMVTESSNRTPQAFSLLAFFQNLLAFPLEFLGDIAPASLLGLFLLRKDARQLLLRQHSFVRFCVLALLFNVLPYWISPGTRIRYIYMLYPLAVIVFTWAYWQRDMTAIWNRKVFGIIIWIILALLMIASLALPFVHRLYFIQPLPWIGAGAALAFGGLTWAYYRKTEPKLMFLLISFALVRLVFDFTIIPERAHAGDTYKNRELAYKIHEICGEAPLFTAFEEYPMSFSTAYYLNRLRGRVLKRNDRLQAGTFYWLPEDRLPPGKVVIISHVHEGVRKVLIRY
jgi:4-amino-4-deoxy-L-arabinose transferase-like glycosyltransferase